MEFQNKLFHSIETKNSHVCVGLDSRYDRIPDSLKKGRSISQSIFKFNQNVVEATSDVAVVYKMNVAFYAGFGAEGLEGLRLTTEWIRSHYQDIPLLADCKRSEMGESVKMVKQEIFNWLNFDCVMVTPWFGFDTVRDYLDDNQKGVCVYVHDSNPSAREFQDLELVDGRRVYEAVTERVVTTWNSNGNVFVEAGATYLPQLKRVRQIVGDEMVILTAGVGAQGAQVTDLSSELFGKQGKRLLVNSSRGIIFAGEGAADYFEKVRAAALTLKRDLLQQAGLS
jgi:orotidine-5'-phosphate decarboxylase